MKLELKYPEKCYGPQVYFKDEPCKESLALEYHFNSNEFKLSDSILKMLIDLLLGQTCPVNLYYRDDDGKLSDTVFFWEGNPFTIDEITGMDYTDLAEVDWSQTPWDTQIQTIAHHQLNEFMIINVDTLMASKKEGVLSFKIGMQWDQKNVGVGAVLQLSTEEAKILRDALNNALECKLPLGGQKLI